MSENGYPDRHWLVVRRTRRAAFKSVVIMGVVAVLLTAAAIVWDGWAFAAAAADAIFLLVCWVSVFGVLDDYRYVAIHPYFQKPVGDIYTFASGYEVARQAQQLDQIATDHGVVPLSRFGFNDDMAGEEVEWHDAADGLATFTLLLREVEGDPERFENQKKLRIELQRIARALQRAHEQDIRFSLLLRHGNCTNGLEWERRQGTAF